MYGENVVLRLLDEATGVLPLAQLGFSDGVLKSFRGLIGADKGIILATGPTGSGKTTTIYSAISALDRKDKNVMTIEDPIEYEIEGVVQSQVNAKAGVTFANALRSILRQDPDIIYVGEIRDLETAEIAIHAALTGHLVLSTLHTNDAVGAITRLRDIGVKPGLVESALNCSLGQRLVRKICPACAAEYRPDKSVLKKLGLSADSIFSKGQGCESCGNTGYKGRIGIFEVLGVNRAIRALIRDGASEDCIVKAAREQGMKTLFEDGLQKVRDGITTLDELRRVTEAPEQ
jgi:type II secretory ATPase GspE/PulE/Tfp pilus assembly ATPase PilB-like protein